MSKMSLAPDVTCLSWAKPTSSADNCRSDSLAVGYDNGLMLLADFRSKDGNVFPLSKNYAGRGANQTGITCLEWDPLREHIFATGNKQGRIALWDDRNAAKPLAKVRTPMYNQTSISSLSWNVQHSGLLVYATVGTNATSGPDRAYFGVLKCNVSNEGSVKEEIISTDMSVDKVLWSRE